MLAKVLRMLAGLKVEEQKDYVVVRGLRADFISHDIEKHWNTSKIGKFMFNRLGSGQMVFHKFFAPDVLYALEQIMTRKRARTNHREVERVIEGLKLNTWLKQLDFKQPDILDMSRLSNLTVTLKPHQLEFLEQYNDVVPRYGLTGYMLGAAPGSGKTINSLALAEVADSDVVFCCVPKRSVKDVWDKTVSSLYKTPVRYWTSLDESKPLDSSYKVYIFHYENLENLRTFIDFVKMKNYRNPTIILDESHSMNEITAQRTELFVEFCKASKAKHVIWASGTPIKAIGNEAIPFLRTIDPLFNPQVEDRFKAIYGKSASRALDILANRIGLVTFKVDKAIVVGNQVTQYTGKVKVPNANEFTLDSIREDMNKFIMERMKFYKDNMKEYVEKYERALAIHKAALRTRDQLAAFDTYRRNANTIRNGYDSKTMKDIVIGCNKYENTQIIPFLKDKQIREDFKDARSVYKYYDLKVQGEALGRILGKKRTACNVAVANATDVIKLDKELEDGTSEVALYEIIDSSLKKTLIFTNYVEVVQALEQKLRGLGFNPLVVYGDTNKNLPQIVAEYEKNIDANPLIATFQSLSTAVPLTMANTVVMMNAPFRAHDYEQALSRVDRLNQDSPIDCFNLFLDTGDVPNISTRSNDILEWSREQVAVIMGRKTEDIKDVVAMETLYVEKDDKKDTDPYDGFMDYMEGEDRAESYDALRQPVYYGW